MTDRLSLANALADAKIERSAAERIATEIFDAIDDSVPTKAGVQRLEAVIRELELRLEARIDRIVVRLGSLIVIQAGLVFAALRYLPPAH